MQDLDVGEFRSARFLKPEAVGPLDHPRHVFCVSVEVDDQFGKRQLVLTVACGGFGGRVRLNDERLATLIDLYGSRTGRWAMQPLHVVNRLRAKFDPNTNSFNGATEPRIVFERCDCSEERRAELATQHAESVAAAAPEDDDSRGDDDMDDDSDSIPF